MAMQERDERHVPSSPALRRGPDFVDGAPVVAVDLVSSVALPGVLSLYE